MGLMMFRKMLLAGLLLLSGLLSRAQDNKDSTWYYANSLSDYATADLVGLVRVGETKILDTTGGYTVQEVNFEPIKFYKGKTDQRKFRAWLENHHVVWQPGTIHGFYLLKGEKDTPDSKGNGAELFYWLENAGFAVKDTAWLAKIADTAYLKKMVSRYILPDIGGSWAKVTLINIDQKQNEAAGPVNATIRMEEAVPALNLQKGSTVPVIIWPDAYRNPAELRARFQKKGTWQVILTREEGLLHMKTTFMLEQ